MFVSHLCLFPRFGTYLPNGPASVAADPAKAPGRAAGHSRMHPDTLEAGDHSA